MKNNRATCFLSCLLAFLIAGCDWGNTSIKEKENIPDDSGNYTHESDSVIIIEEAREASYEEFIQHKKVISDYSQMLAVLKNGNALLVVDQYFEDGACDGPSYYVSLVDINKNDNKLLFKLHCDTRNNYDEFFKQKDSLMHIFKVYNLVPVTGSITFLAAAEVIKQYQLKETFEKEKREGGTYIKSYTLTKKDSALLELSFPAEDNIIGLSVTGGIILEGKNRLLISVEELREWDLGDITGTARNMYVLVGI